MNYSDLGDVFATDVDGGCGGAHINELHPLRRTFVLGSLGAFVNKPTDKLNVYTRRRRHDTIEASFGSR